MYLPYAKATRYPKHLTLGLRVILLLAMATLMLLLFMKTAQTESVSPAGEKTLPVAGNFLPSADDTNHQAIIDSSVTVIPLAPQQQMKKILYLTFDDGPSKNTTPIILDILKERQVKATFFLLGENVRKHPELTRRIVAEGHGVGVHSDSHIYQQIYQSVGSFEKDFDKASDSIEAVTGIRPKIFRFPGGSINDYNRAVYKDIISAMNRQGYIYYDWNASLEDTSGATTKQAMLTSAGKTVADYDRVVMLAHDTEPATAEVLPALLDVFGDFRKEVITQNDEPIQF